jgi:hypothetical protein
MTFRILPASFRIGPLACAILALPLQSCFVSPLSNVSSPTILPGLMRVNFDVIKETNETTGATRASLEARFFDQLDKRIDLRRGAVYVNDMRMTRHTTAFFGETYYRRSSGITFHHDSLYTFRVVTDTLSDVEYTSTVRTQADDMISSTMVVSGDTVRFMWEGDASHPVRLRYTLYRDVDSITGDYQSRSRMYEPPHAQPLTVSLEGYEKVSSYQLESVVRGTIHPAFRAGSIESRVRLRR